MIERTAAYARRHSLTERALIEREVTLVGVLGEHHTAWEVSETDVPCRIIRAGRERGDMTDTAGAVETLPEQYRIALPSGTPIGVNHRITVGSTAYSVVGVEAMLTQQFFRMVTVIRR